MTKAIDLLFQLKPPVRFTDDIIFSRDKYGNIKTNINQRVIYHSPDGFEWGYGGSGPADFALNILLNFVDGKTAWIYHQEFKWQFIAGLKKPGGTIPNDIIRSWLKRREAL